MHLLTLKIDIFAVDFHGLLRCFRSGLFDLCRVYLLKKVDCWKSSGWIRNFRDLERCFYDHIRVCPNVKKTKYDVLFCIVPFMCF